eukprot:4256739-Alexandrium_andersonii.AAC.1
MPSAAPFAIPTSSASPELSAIVFWVAGQHLIARGPHVAAPPRVDRRVARRPAKSVSACAVARGPLLPWEVAHGARPMQQ